MYGQEKQKKNKNKKKTPGELKVGYFCNNNTVIRGDTLLNDHNWYKIAEEENISFVDWWS